MSDNTIEEYKKLVRQRFSDPKAYRKGSNLRPEKFYEETFIHPEKGIEGLVKDFSYFNLAHKQNYFDFIDLYLKTVKKYAKNCCPDVNESKVMLEFAKSCKKSEQIELIKRVTLFDDPLDHRELKIQILKREYEKFQRADKKNVKYPFVNVQDVNEFDNFVE